MKPRMSPKNLVLITVDSLRYDALGCDGAVGVSTPSLDGLARRGVLLRQAVANGPRTQSSFPSIMCSLYPLAAGEREALPAEATTLAEALRGAGYRTAALNPSNPFLTRESGYHRGFDLFVDFWDVHPRQGPHLAPGRWRSMKRRVHDAMGRRDLGFLMLFQAAFQREGGQYLTGEVIVDQGVAWAREQGGPFFLWLHLMDVHYPYTPLPGQWSWRDRVRCMAGMAGLLAGRPRGALQRLRSLYDSRVELVDRILGQLLERMEEAGLCQRTVVVVTSDHGERFCEHGGHAHGPDLYEELLRVPLIVSGPGIPAGLESPEQVSLIGMAPTLLELAGVPVPQSFAGKSFLPLLQGRSGCGEPYAFSEAMHSGGRESRVGVADRYRVMSCRTPGWKLIRDEQGPVEELYDLTADPGERTNLVGERLTMAGELRRELDRHQEEVVREASRFADRRERGIAADDDDVRQRLAALGYL